MISNSGLRSLQGWIALLSVSGLVHPGRLFAQEPVSIVTNGPVTTARGSDRIQPTGGTAYEGTYHSDYYGDLVIILTPGNTLKLALGKDQKLSYDLAHWDKNIFTFRIEMES